MNTDPTVSRSGPLSGDKEVAVDMLDTDEAKVILVETEVLRPAQTETERMIKSVFNIC